MSGKGHADGSIIPIFTHRTCTEPSCDGLCGRRHPNGAPDPSGDGGEAA